MKKVCIIAQFPPPIHGLSKAVETLYSKLNNKIYNFEKINITNNKLFPINVIKVIFSKSELYYLTISQSKWGNIRDLILLKIIALKRKKYVIHLHGGYFDKLLNNDISKAQKSMNYRLLRRAEKIIVLSDSLKKIFDNIVEDSKIQVISNCVDDFYLASADEIEKKIKKNNKIKKVLYLSNFIKEKGYPYVLEMALLEKKNYEKTGNRNFHFCFAGKFYSLKDKIEFENYIKVNELNDYIDYYGIVNGVKKKELLIDSDVFILLTSFHKEGQPISIIEALGNGNVVVSTNHAAIPDMIKDDYNGILVDKDCIDVQSLYERLLVINYSDIIKNNYNEIPKYKEDVYLKKMRACFDSCFLEDSFIEDNNEKNKK